MVSKVHLGRAIGGSIFKTGYFDPTLCKIYDRSASEVSKVN